MIFDSIEVSSPLSPSGISWALESLNDSLEKLEPINLGCEWPSHDGSRMDLSQMKALRSLSCPSACFFGPGGAFEQRSGLFKLLPSALEELKARGSIQNIFLPFSHLHTKSLSR
jgi:hypothetical protein